MCHYVFISFLLCDLLLFITCFYYIFLFYFTCYFGCLFSFILFLFSFILHKKPKPHHAHTYAHLFQTSHLHCLSPLHAETKPSLLDVTGPFITSHQRPLLQYITTLHFHVSFPIPYNQPSYSFNTVTIAPHIPGNLLT